MIKIARVEWLGGHCLRVWFNDGTVGDHDLSSIRAEAGAMVEPLHDPDFFGRVFVEDGALTWPNGYDAAPGWVHQEIQAAGGLKRIVAA